MARNDELDLLHEGQMDVGALRAFLQDWPDSAPVWISDYDEVADTLTERPMEGMGGQSSPVKGSYLSLG